MNLQGSRLVISVFLAPAFLFADNDWKEHRYSISGCGSALRNLVIFNFQVEFTDPELQSVKDTVVAFSKAFPDVSFPEQFVFALNRRNKAPSLGCDGIIRSSNSVPSMLHEVSHVVLEENMNSSWGKERPAVSERWDEYERARAPLEQKRARQRRNLEAAGNDLERQQAKTKVEQTEAEITAIYMYYYPYFRPRENKTFLGQWELFSDLLTVIYLKDPQAMRKEFESEAKFKELMEEHKISRQEAELYYRARDFSVSIKPNDWLDTFPYSDEHAMFGPVRSYLGKLLFNGGSFSGDPEAIVPLVIQAMKKDRPSWDRIGGDQRSNADKNRDLIQLIEAEIKNVFPGRKLSG